MDAVQAAALLDQTQRSTRQALQIRYAPIYLAWGVAWLVGLGAMWLSVRGQQPYYGPSGVSAAVLGTLLGAAALVTSLVIVRATKGVGGQSAVQGAIWGAAFSAGYAEWFAVAGAIDHYGASRAVLGIAYAVGPALVTGLLYMVAAAIWAEVKPCCPRRASSGETIASAPTSQICPWSRVTSVVPMNWEARMRGSARTAGARSRIRTEAADQKAP